ncbi:hypothetical protein GGTG_13556 [Gaeumannomyces tritici R3-111a-1]|uniref:Uncharacterized protein n=1 Tax=Gaeumannomyces tritici (strain R3-111a-1) TaxID=644352 RepID=J3PJ74_GAET3|nr:hypothetical protein GGTG_13556 [Gaeumannomyces tritici R3-111a-1]EJT68892.1 hypothetical protein GGTG_13556 [Gaeumannomyces tritici R3-111a-1]
MESELQNTSRPAAVVAALEKKKVARQSDEKLLKRSDKYGKITWVELPTQKEHFPPQATIALVVDVPENKGAIKVYERKNDEYVGMVGSAYANSMVIIEWNEGWWFRVVGSIRVGYITNKDDRSEEGHGGQVVEEEGHGGQVAEEEGHSGKPEV